GRIAAVFDFHRDDSRGVAAGAAQRHVHAIRFREQREQLALAAAERFRAFDPGGLVDFPTWPEIRLVDAFCHTLTRAVSRPPRTIARGLAANKFPRRARSQDAH